MKNKTSKKKNKNFINISPVVAFIIVIIIILITVISFNFLGEYQKSYKNTKTKFDFTGGFDTSIYSDNHDIEEIYDTTVDNTTVDNTDTEQETLVNKPSDENIKPDTSTDIDKLKNKNKDTTIEPHKDNNENEQNHIDSYYSDGINAILTNKDKEKYCSNMFSFENPFENIEVLRFTCTEQNIDENYIIGVVETPTDDILCRFDYTLDDKYFMSIKCKQI